MKELSRHGRYINSCIGKAIDTYNLIEDGDKILVAISGGKDSMSLLKLLKERLRWIPVQYELIACHVRTDFHCASCTHTDYLTDYLRSWGSGTVLKILRSWMRKDKLIVSGARGINVKPFLRPPMSWDAPRSPSAIIKTT